MTHINQQHILQTLAEVSTLADQQGSKAPLVLAVSKTRSAEEVQQAHEAGLCHFGENYLQEALDKISQLKSSDICWHFIGPIQSNKTRAICEHFDWVHSVDRFKIAQRLSDQRPNDLPPLNVCIQVNIDEEKSKSGVNPRDCLSLAQQILLLPNIQLRGLMCIPKAAPNKADKAFGKMAALLTDLQGQLPEVLSLDTLSMGMSNDYPLAMKQGATIIRLGTVLFGPRNN